MTVDERAEKVGKQLFLQGWLANGVTKEDFVKCILPHFEAAIDEALEEAKKTALEYDYEENKACCRDTARGIANEIEALKGKGDG